MITDCGIIEVVDYGFKAMQTVFLQMESGM